MELPVWPTTAFGSDTDFEHLNLRINKRKQVVYTCWLNKNHVLRGIKRKFEFEEGGGIFMTTKLGSMNNFSIVYEDYVSGSIFHENYKSGWEN
jgi:hypothetical protein